MKVLLTGATGHLGANLVRRLLADGHEVSALLRPTSDREAIKGLDLSVIEGDVRDEASVLRACQGIDALFHTAAMVSIRNVDRAALMETNVRGTHNVMQAALAASVKRVVHTSSFGALGGPNRSSLTEDDDLDPFEEVMDYERTKAASELPVLRAVAQGLSATIVNPSAIVGPYDFRPSNIGRVILDVAHGRMRAYIPGAFDWVPMADVVEGHLLAWEKGAPGRRYLLSGQEHSVDQMLDWIAEFAGCKRPAISIPPSVMGAVAALKDNLYERFFPLGKPRFNQHSIRLLTSGKRGDNTRAQRELGLVPSDVKSAVEQAVAWFAATGRIPQGTVQAAEKFAS